MTVNRRPATVGQVVVLRSGSEPMTIESLAKPGFAVCIWFDKARFRRLTFPLAALDIF